MATVLNSIVAGASKTITLAANLDGDLQSGYVAPDLTKRITVSGIDFGGAPNYVIFDQFIGADGDPAFRTPDFGEWTAVCAYGGAGAPKLHYDSTTGRTWMACRDASLVGNSEKNLQSLFLALAAHSQFRISHRAWVPPDRCFPGSLITGVMPAASSWKMTWNGINNGLDNDLIGRDIPYRNVCIPSHIGNGLISIGGNNNSPKYLNVTEKAFYSNFSFDSPTYYSWYQSGPGTHGEYTEVGELISVNDISVINKVEMIDPFASTEPDVSFTTRTYDAVTFPGWFGGGPGNDYTNCLPLSADFIMATGANCRAKVLISDNAVFANSTVAYEMLATEWASNIEFWTEEFNDLGENLHVHVWTSDGTLNENLPYVRG